MKSQATRIAEARNRERRRAYREASNMDYSSLDPMGVISALGKMGKVTHASPEPSIDYTQFAKKLTEEEPSNGETEERSDREADLS